MKLVFFNFLFILCISSSPLVNEVYFKEEAQDTEPKPLGMEHFYFPLGLWLAGVVVSVICLLAEIIINCKENQQ